MKRVIRVSHVFIGAACMATMSALAQNPIEQSGNISRTATIAAINHTTRVVTLKDSQERVEDIVCGPEIKRFDELSTLGCQRVVLTAAGRKR